MKDTPPVRGDHKEAVENAKGQQWHGEEIHRRDSVPMIAQKRGPSFSRLWASRRLAHRSGSTFEAWVFELIESRQQWLQYLRYCSVERQVSLFSGTWNSITRAIAGRRRAGFRSHAMHRLEDLDATCTTPSAN